MVFSWISGSNYLTASASGAVNFSGDSCLFRKAADEIAIKAKAHINRK